MNIANPQYGRPDHNGRPDHKTVLYHSMVQGDGH